MLEGGWQVGGGGQAVQELGLDVGLGGLGPGRRRERAAGKAGELPGGAAAAGGLVAGQQVRLGRERRLGEQRRLGRWRRLGGLRAAGQAERQGGELPGAGGATRLAGILADGGAGAGRQVGPGRAGAVLGSVAGLVPWAGRAKQALQEAAGRRGPGRNLGPAGDCQRGDPG